MEASRSLLLAGPSASDSIRDLLPATLILDGVALFLALVIYAVLAAIVTLLPGPGAVAIRVLRPLSMAVTAFVLGLVLQEIFGIQLHRLPLYGIVSPDTTGFSPSDLFFDRILHLILPALTLSLASVGVTLAIANVSDFNVRGRHSSWPRLVAYGLGAILGGTFVVEPIFAWPGIGSMAVQAAQGLGPGSRSVLTSSVFTVALIYVVLALVVGIGGALLAPRGGSPAKTIPMPGTPPISGSGGARGGGIGTARVVVMAVAGAFVLLVVLAALIGPLVSPSSATFSDLQNVFGPPQPGHLLGFDALGRDELGRLISAARAPFGLGLLATIIAASVGTGLGALLGVVAQAESGLAAIVEVVVTVLTGFPAFALALVLLAIPLSSNSTPPSNFTLALAFSLPGIQLFVRYATALTSSQTAVTTAGASGGVSFRPLIAQLPVALALAMLLESAMSFLGFGVQPPDFDWGAMLSNSQEFINSDAALLYLPALALGLTVLALVALGEAIRGRVE